MEASQFFELELIEDWRNDVNLYQPTENGQLLLPDKAICLSVQAFLKMCELDYEVNLRQNVEDMSPSGQIPFLKCNIFLVSGLETIIKFIEQRGVSLTKHLEDAHKSELKAYFSLVNCVLGNAANYFAWADKESFNGLTKVRFDSIYPWPLNSFIVKRKQKTVFKSLDAMNWLNQTKEDVCSEVEKCLTALSDNLGERLYFFGTQPTELDAVVFAYIYAMLTTPLSEAYYGGIIHNFPKLIEHCKRIANKYFSDLKVVF